MVGAVGMAVRVSALAPFRVRSFRFQWPADLATSWAFEMENLILGWYVLVETRSVLMLTVFASLQYVGTLLAPVFGVTGDRIGHRNLLCVMRFFYALLAATIMVLALAGVLRPGHVLAIAALMGLVRPSDIGMRGALIGETIPAGHLVGAMGVQRITQDSARVAGSLSGAGLVALLGMGPAYAVVASLYAVSVLLTRRAGAKTGRRGARGAITPRASLWRDLKEGAAYVWATPHLRAVMLLAFLLNGTAFPLFSSLLPYVAKEVYQADQETLGYMVACGALGSLLGSIAISRFGGSFRPARLMIVCALAWYAALLVFGRVQHPDLGVLVLLLAGLASSVGLIPMMAILIRDTEPKFRGRVMGIRMLALYANLPGLLIAGPLIGAFGYAAVATLYCLLGIAITLLVAVRWRSTLWRAGALANAH